MSYRHGIDPPRIAPGNVPGRLHRNEQRERKLVRRVFGYLDRWRAARVWIPWAREDRYWETHEDWI